MAIIGELAGPQQRKAAFALTRLAINLGMSIGPVVGGFLAMYSFKLLFYVDGITSLLAGALIAILPWRQFNPQSLEKDVVQKPVTTKNPAFGIPTCCAIDCLSIS
jgi:MFS family permease